MSEKNSFKLMSRSGIIKRTDTGMFIRHADIHQRPGFNLRDKNDPDFAVDDASLDAHIAAGGHVPPLEVVARDDGGVWVVEGHRRTDSFGRRIAAGQVIEWIRIDPFIGNDKQQQIRVLTAAEGRKLKPLEVAEGYRRLAVGNNTPDEIAALVHKTRQHVDQMLILASAPAAVQRMVALGVVSASVAVEVTRKHGEMAEGFLTAELDKAQAGGKGKVTAGSIKPWSPPAKIVAPLVHAMGIFISQLPPTARQSLASIETAEQSGQLPEGQMVSVPTEYLLALMSEFDKLEQSREAAAEKLRTKAAKASQMNIGDAK